MEPTCVHCGSDKEPYFSRSEPMGVFCVDCGRNFDEVDPQDFKEITKQLAAERALADRLFKDLKELWDHHTLYGAAYEVIEPALTAWKEARSE